MGKVVKIVVAIAIIAVVAYYAPAISAALVHAGFTAAAASAAIAVGAAVVSIGASLALNAIFPPPSAKSGGTSAMQVFRQSISNSFIIYGKRRAGGLMVFYHPKGKSWRYYVIACAGHRCRGAVGWYLNDEPVEVDGSGMVNSGVYAGHAWLWFARGTDDQAANATFVAECDGQWTEDHRGRGIAAIYAKFEMTDAVVQAGMPLINAVIEGKDDIRDPRTGDIGYTRLATPIIYDWLALPRAEGGFGAAADEIPDDDLLSAWTNVCDEDLTVALGVTEKRYELDCWMTTGSAPSDIRKTFVDCVAGSYTYSDGKFLLRPGYWVGPSHTLSERDLSGPIKVTALGDPQAIVNEINGTFIDPANNYQPMPVPTRSIGGVDDEQGDADLPHITSSTRGERILEIMLRRAQCEKRVSWPMNIAGIAVEALETVQLDTARYGLSNYAFVVDQWGLSSDFSVGLQLREENEDIYSDDITYRSGFAAPALATADPIDTAQERIRSLLIPNSYTAGLAGNVTSATSGSTASITIPSHTRVYPAPQPSVSVTGATLTGLALSATVMTTFLVYYDDASLAGGAVTYHATTSAADAYFSASHPDRHFVCFVNFPVIGGGSGTPGGSSTPGGGGWSGNPGEQIP